MSPLHYRGIFDKQAVSKKITRTYEENVQLEKYYHQIKYIVVVYVLQRLFVIKFGLLG